MKVRKNYLKYDFKGSVYDILSVNVTYSMVNSPFSYKLSPMYWKELKEINHAIPHTPSLPELAVLSRGTTVWRPKE